MRTHRLALIGFGNVGQGLATILRDRRDDLEAQGVAFPIVAVATGRRGSVYEPDGLDPAALLSAAESGARLDSLPAAHADWDVERILRESNADVVVEVTPTDTVTAEPATGTIRTALSSGRHVITANKGPIALHYPELAALAAANGVTLGVEGTVMGGTPVLRVGSQLLAGAGISRIQGILNGTTNYILTQMGQGESYASALADAQAKGYAETDPTADVEGFDAAVKTVILGNLLLGGKLGMADVDCQGISRLTVEDVAAAQAEGMVWKLIGRVEKTAAEVSASVRPTRLPLSHPLATVNGPTNALTFTTDLLGDVTIVGPGAGRVQTGYALLSDLLEIP